MRKNLRARDGQRFRVTAIVERSGLKRGWQGREQQTLMLRNLVDANTGELLDDHLWFTAGKWSEGLQAGDMIEFDARVGPYEKGYFGRREDVFAPPSTDWRLTRPTKVKRLTKQEAVRCCRYYPDCSHVKARAQQEP